MNAAGADPTPLIDELIKGPQYRERQADKDVKLLAILKPLSATLAGACPPYRRFLERLGDPPDSWTTPADVPPLPVSMFKRYELRAVPEEKVVRELNSSSTTGDRPSRIFLDKTTSFRQTRALAAILKGHLGSERRPYLVLDAEEAAAASDRLVARGAAIRGIGTFASETVYGCDLDAGGDITADFDRIGDFIDRHPGEPVLLFGFTFMVWTRFVLEAEKRGIRFRLPGATLLHSGGWKKLREEAVSRGEFSSRTAAVLGCEPASILDFYGMVEQVGTVFVDCEAGHKHAPAFADVIIRRPLTFEPVAPGEEGIIEVLSVLPASYPGLAVLTEDQGELLGEDDCPCGRRGRHFRFTSRVERVEVRGCGDVFAKTRAIVKELP